MKGTDLMRRSPSSGTIPAAPGVLARAARPEYSTHLLPVVEADGGKPDCAT
jgi:hypothetical protein